MRGQLAIGQVLLALLLLLLLALRFALTRVKHSLALQSCSFLLLLVHFMLCNLHLHALIPVLQLHLPAALLLNHFELRFVLLNGRGLGRVAILMFDAFEHSLLHDLLLVLPYAFLRRAQCRLPLGECLHRLLFGWLHGGPLTSGRRVLDGLAITCLCRSEPVEKVCLSVAASGWVRLDTLCSCNCIRVHEGLHRSEDATLDGRGSRIVTMDAASVVCNAHLAGSAMV